jgi:hypothetical protein
MIGISQLGIETYLNGFPSRSSITGPNLCSINPSDYGLTPEQWQEIRDDAYTYEVRIYGYTLSENERNEIDIDLSTFEPRRSSHAIVDGLDPNDMIDGDN